MQKHFPPAPKSEWSYWHVKIEPLPSEILTADHPLTQQAAIGELRERDAAEALGKPSSVEPEDIEANRIAGELVKLYHAGAIAGPSDPEAIFYACLIRGFEATFLQGKN
jgi:hypothetical protein